MRDCSGGVEDLDRLISEVIEMFEGSEFDGAVVFDGEDGVAWGDRCAVWVVLLAECDVWGGAAVWADLRHGPADSRYP